VHLRGEVDKPVDSSNTDGMSSPSTLMLAFALTQAAPEPAAPLPLPPPLAEPTPAAIVDPTDTPAPPVTPVTPPAAPASSSPPSVAPTQSALQPDPPMGVARQPINIGLAAGLGACVGALVGGPTGGLLTPLTAPVGMAFGICLAADADGGQPETTPLIIGGTVAVLAAGVVGGAVGAGLSAVAEQNRPESDGLFGSIGSGSIAILLGGVVGATVSMTTLGSAAAGVTVGIMASQATPTTVQPHHQRIARVLEFDHEVVE
jgi:hypothetical protein